MSALDHFSAPTRAWFEAAFASPTPAQEGAWDAIAAGRNALVVAPTGSGKTLSAFLHAIDTLLTSQPREEKPQRTRVLYISPLKALAVDVERNLRAPLTGIRHTAERLEVTMPEVTRRAPVRRHQPGRPSQARHDAARHPDHDPRVAVPDAHQPGPRDAARHRDGHHRRGPRRRRHQARRPPRRSASSASTPCSTRPPSASGSAPPSARSRRSPVSSAAARRSRSCRPSAARSGTSGSSSPSRT